MTYWMYGATAFAACNVIMLLLLTSVWVTNYRRYRSDVTLGFLCFGSALLAENILAVYFFFTMSALYAATESTQQIVFLLRILEFVALAFLTRVTLR